MHSVVSSIKRDEIKRQKKLEQVKKLRAALPVLTRDQIRRIRLPYHEAIIQELEELKCISSAEFFGQLFKYQEDLRNHYGPLSAFWAKPRLFECRKELDILFNGLKTAELAHYAGNIGTECDELLKLGKKFGFSLVNWSWLGEQLLLQAVNVSSTYQKDGGKKAATSKYIFGRFLLEKLSDAHRAKEELQTARELSIGRSWTIEREAGAKRYTIFVESCRLLFRCLMIEVKALIYEKPLEALRICKIAIKRANEACDRKDESEALMAQGLCQMQLGEAKAAIESFFKVLVYQTKAGKANGTCEARIYLALAHLRIGRLEDTYRHLEALLRFTEVQQLDYYRGQALRFLGEYYLNQSVSDIATRLLMSSLEVFHAIGDIENREQVKNLAAISAGQELLRKYIALILKCGMPGEKGEEYVVRLVKWKDTRELFWTEEEEPDYTYSTTPGLLTDMFKNQSSSAFLGMEEEEDEEINEDEGENKVKSKDGSEYKSETQSKLKNEAEEEVEDEYEGKDAGKGEGGAEYGEDDSDYDH